MNGGPYVQLYTSDFLGGTSGMTATTKGVYITLICLMYESEAPLGQSWQALSRRCGCTLPGFKKAVQDLLDEGKMSVSDAGIWSSKCDKHIALRHERRSSAKAAADERWRKTKQKQRIPDTDALQAQCQPEPKPKREGKPSLSIGQISDDFDAFWVLCPRKVAKGRARKAYGDARKKASAEDIGRGMDRHAKSVLGKEATYIPHPASWLNDERWNDEIEPMETQNGKRHSGNHRSDPHGALHAGFGAEAVDYDGRSADPSATMRDVTPPGGETMAHGPDCDPSQPLLRVAYVRD